MSLNLNICIQRKKFIPLKLNTYLVWFYFAKLEQNTTTTVNKNIMYFTFQIPIRKYSTRCRLKTIYVELWLHNVFSFISMKASLELKIVKKI